MSALNFVYDYGLWLAPPVFCGSVALLVWIIVKLVRLVKASFIMRVPLVEDQDVEFAESGKIILWGEGPQLTTRFAWLRYSMTDAAGTPVPSRPVLHATMTGIKWARISLRLFHVPQPGVYTLHIDRFGDPQPRDAKHAIIFSRRYINRAVVHVLGIVAASHLLIGSLVLFLMRLFGVE